MKAAEIRSYLEEKYLFLSGKRNISLFSSMMDLTVGQILGAVDKKGYFIITFPSPSSIEKLSIDDLRKLIIYLASIKFENIFLRKFSFLKRRIFRSSQFL